MKTTLSYVSYFQDLVERSTLIDSFYYGYDEFKENASEAEGTIFVLEPYENNFSENQNDNNLATRQGFFVILKPYASDIGREYAEVQDACERLAMKVVGQMKRDSRENIITTDIQNWRGEPAAPIVGNFIGYSISFNYEAGLNTLMAFDEDDWIIES
jgi:hypothetical protein